MSLNMVLHHYIWTNKIWSYFVVHFYKDWCSSWKYSMNHLGTSPLIFLFKIKKADQVVVHVKQYRCLILVCPYKTRQTYQHITWEILSILISFWLPSTCQIVFPSPILRLSSRNFDLIHIVFFWISYCLVCRFLDIVHSFLYVVIIERGFLLILSLKN